VASSFDAEMMLTRSPAAIIPLSSARYSKMGAIQQQESSDGDISVQYGSQKTIKKIAMSPSK
jgi:hypothetical protein